jgi:hypothetical protein
MTFFTGYQCTPKRVGLTFRQPKTKTTTTKKKTQLPLRLLLTTIVLMCCQDPQSDIKIVHMSAYFSYISSAFFSEFFFVCIQMPKETAK